MLIHSCKVQKNSKTLTIDFPPELFSEPPIVIVTPFWENSMEQAPFIETVNSVLTTQVKIASVDYLESDYYVSVFAIGKGTGVGDVGFKYGKEAKSEPSLTMKFIEDYPLQSKTPAGFVTPYFTSTPGAYVEFQETITGLTNKKMTVVSPSRMTDLSYNVQYFAADLGIFEHQGGDSVRLMTGIEHKTDAGKYRVYFHSAFSEPPTVILSPYWVNANTHASGVPTITKVSSNYFEMISTNYGDNLEFYFCWAAYGYGLR